MKFTNAFADKVDKTLEIWRQVGLKPTRIEMHVDTVREHFGGVWGVVPSGRMFVPTDDGSIGYASYLGLQIYMTYDRENDSSYDTKFKEIFSDRRK